MANFFGVFGGTEAQREAAVRRVGDLAPLPGLRDGCFAHGALTVRWSIGQGAPLHAGARGDDAVVCFGDAWRPGEDTPALGVRGWLAPLADTGCDGYYACLRATDDGALHVEADHLGLFPVFFVCHGALTAVAASQESLVRFLGDDARLDPVDAAGTLLLCMGFGDRTPWAGIRRLRPGHRLRVGPDGDLRETPISPTVIPRADRTDFLPDDEAESRLCDALHRAVARQTARRPFRLLLSGGIDSRILAGICRNLGQAPLTLTLGRPSDLEMVCARNVARHQGWRQRAHEASPDRRVAFARTEARWGHLDAGAGHLGWEIADGLAGGEAPVLNGVGLDGVIYGLELDADASFERVFPLVWDLRGVPSHLLEKLLRPGPWRDALPEAIARFHTYWRAAGPDDGSRTFVAHLQHRHRTQIGRMLWQFSFRGWPLVPHLDRDVLRAADLLLPASLDDGRVRAALLRHRWPDLARLPIDSNRNRTDPLIPTRPLWQEAAIGKVRTVQSLLGHERRRYVRTLDLHGDGWRAIRAQGQTDPRPWDAWIDPRVAADLMAPPRRPQHLCDTVVGHAPGRNVAHLLLWAARHPEAVAASLR